MYEELTFNSLFEYPGNKRAIKACKSIIKYPKSQIIVGDDGMRKRHLLYSVYNQGKDTSSILIKSGLNFINTIIRSMNRHLTKYQEKSKKNETMPLDILKINIIESCFNKNYDLILIYDAHRIIQDDAFIGSCIDVLLQNYFDNDTHLLFSWDSQSFNKISKLNIDGTLNVIHIHQMEGEDKNEFLSRLLLNEKIILESDQVKKICNRINGSTEYLIQAITRLKYYTLRHNLEKISDDILTQYLDQYYQKS